MKTLFAIIIITFFSAAAFAQAGELDSTFGGDGIVTTDFFGGNDEAQCIAIQPDGKIIVAGYALQNGSFQDALARYLPNGTLDSSFGNGGLEIYHVGQIFSYIMSIAI